MRTCVFCKRRDTKSGDVSFFKFPADKEILQLWIKNMNYNPNWLPSKYQYLCSQHFSNQCLDFRDKVFSMRKGSIPTIFGLNNENKYINYRQILDSNNLNQQDIDLSKESSTLQSIEKSLQVTNDVSLSKSDVMSETIASITPTSNSQKSVNSLAMEFTPKIKPTETSSRIINHDHSYVETVEKLKNNLMIARTKIHQLKAKNHILAKNHKLSKKKIVAMKKRMTHLSAQKEEC